MFLNILVAVDGSRSSDRALESAVELARAMRSRLTVLTVAPPLAHYVTFAGVSSETMRKELDRWAAKILDEATALVPDDVIAHRVQRTGHAGPEILAEVSPVDSARPGPIAAARGRGSGGRGSRCRAAPLVPARGRASRARPGRSRLA